MNDFRLFYNFLVTKRSNQPPSTLFHSGWFSGSVERNSRRSGAGSHACKHSRLFRHSKFCGTFAG